MMSTYTIALSYDNAGICLIPAVYRGKVPALKSWKSYQRERPSKADLRDWFDGERPHNIAIVCGAVSQNLAVLDFDEGDGFQRWAQEYPELVTAAPIVRTGGAGDRRHVYLRTRNPVATKANPFNGCDYVKGDGGYVIAPSSIHATGRYYKLLSGDFSKIPLVDPIPTIKTTDNQATQDPHIACVPSLDPLIAAAIVRTLPMGPGQRNRKLFEFARSLKGICPNASSSELRAIVTEWFRRCVSVVRTKDFTTTWIDFCVAWQNVRVAAGQALRPIVEKAKSMPTPVAGLIYDDTEMQLLVALCWCLQEYHDVNPFYLSCRTVERAIGISRTNAARMLKTLVFDGVLKLVSSGELKLHQAAEYQYIAEERP